MPKAQPAQVERDEKTGISGFLSRKFGIGAPVVPVVRLHGVIAAEQRPGRLNIQMVEPLLTKAFAIKNAPAVAIVINSPGGSPVQSRLISKRIRDLADEHEKQVLVFVEDVAASGGYFIAVAGDEIIADPSSIVGSIGVVFAGFGFEEAIKKIGVTRRIYTAGKNKATLDPFMPENQDDVARLKEYENDIHQVFIDHVKSRRGDKLKAADDDLFTGEWWTAGRGVNLGLVDCLGDIQSELQRRFGKKIRLKSIAAKRPMFRLPLPGLSAATAFNEHGLASDMLMTLEDRAIWSRFGL